MIHYLYVKQHNQTLLKYLGKTIQNPYKYRGSGKYWKKHLKVHGNDVDTYIIGTYDTVKELKEAGIYYSHVWDVIESNEWANLTPETGEGGNNLPNSGSFKQGRIPWNKDKPGSQIAWNKGKPFNEESRKRMSQAQIGRKKEPFSPETCEKIRQIQLQRTKHPMSGKKHSEKSKERMRQSRIRFLEKQKE